MASTQATELARGLIVFTLISYPIAVFLIGSESELVVARIASSHFLCPPPALSAYELVIDLSVCDLSR